VEFETEKAVLLSPVVRMLYKGYTNSTSSVKFLVNADIAEFCKDEESVAPLMRPLTPDHIVYCRARFLFVRSEADASAQRDALKSAFGDYVAEYGYAPKVVLVQGLGAFVCGSTKKEADTVGALFLDAIAVAIYTRSFGGYLHLTEELESFIVNWEVESYRQKVSFNPSASKRLLEKIAIVTGGAQGFGKGIAEKLIEQGAMVAIADVNIAAAQEVADSMNAGGIKKALAVKCDVTDEESVKNLIYSCVLEFGGLDMFVNNAGIVKAGDLETMDKRSFELVTSVNYTAYYLCAKYASRIMKLQHTVAPEEMFDIIEINSKSGLAGSNKNFAYAGSKFGGIGLTQSFAMELAEYNIKVNAICPGNFLDGPLWSDPEKGLFVQYLRSGKVPGAKTVEDVKKSYTDKVPLRRGCTVEDVMCALLYIAEQKYETGQAVPVTGGQEMLK
jgi:NAD(P)-dependent dehydrogenase (short-subunit alcohol dehydrogenase family)